jgi:hypothetical protein
VSWRIFQILEATRDEYGNWRHLPFAGGVLNQPGWLLDDLLALKSVSRKFESQLEKKHKEKKHGS